MVAERAPDFIGGTHGRRPEEEGQERPLARELADHEVKYVARKTGSSSAEVRKAKAESNGTGRKEVEQKLKK